VQQSHVPSIFSAELRFILCRERNLEEKGLGLGQLTPKDCSLEETEPFFPSNW
jgi:hypothetical protein